jgi:hypothetical protein
LCPMYPAIDVSKECTPQQCIIVWEISCLGDFRKFYLSTFRKEAANSFLVFDVSHYRRFKGMHTAAVYHCPRLGEISGSFTCQLAGRRRRIHSLCPMYPAIDVSKECEPRQRIIVRVCVKFQEVLLVSFPEGGGEFIPCVRCILLSTFQRNANRDSVALSVSG